MTSNPVAGDRLRGAAAFAAVAVFSLSALSACSVEPPMPSPETPAGPSAAPPGEVVEDDCLVGDWVISQDQLQGFYDGVAANSDGLSFTVDGNTGLSFSDTSYSYTPNFALLLDVAGMPGEGDLSGSISGDYTVADEVITTTHDESSVVFDVTVNGITTDGSELFGSLLSSAPINAAPYSCTAAGPVIQFSTGGDTRVPVRLTAAD